MRNHRFPLRFCFVINRRASLDVDWRGIRLSTHPCVGNTPSQDQDLEQCGCKPCDAGPFIDIPDDCVECSRAKNRPIRHLHPLGLGFASRLERPFGN
jgi:hypothetical protein